jgi:hypothetical protein
MEACVRAVAFGIGIIVLTVGSSGCTANLYSNEVPARARSLGAPVFSSTRSMLPAAQALPPSQVAPPSASRQEAPPQLQPVLLMDDRAAVAVSEEKTSASAPEAPPPPSSKAPAPVPTDASGVRMPQGEPGVPPVFTEQTETMTTGQPTTPAFGEVRNDFWSAPKQEMMVRRELPVQGPTGTAMPQGRPTPPPEFRTTVESMPLAPHGPPPIQRELSFFRE